MTKEHQPEESAAIELFTAQLSKLSAIRQLDYTRPEFITWRDTVTDLFQRFLRPDSSHFVTFREIRFRGPGQIQPARRRPFSYRGPLPRSSGISQEYMNEFRKGCEIAEGCIQGAIETIRNFGVHRKGAERKGPQKDGDIQQNFHAPVTIHNQALPTGKAIQSIERMGDEGGTLQEIALLLQQS